MKLDYRLIGIIAIVILALAGIGVINADNIQSILEIIAGWFN